MQDLKYKTSEYKTFFRVGIFEKNIRVFFKLGLKSVLGYCINYKKSFLEKYKKFI